MGKILDALTQAETPERRKAEPASAEELLPGEDREEVPFIEVGPHRSLEASPSVLASIPAPALAAPPVAMPPRPSAAQARGGVTFRPLARRAAPRPQMAPELVAYHSPDQPASASYRDLLAATLGALGEPVARPVLFFTAAGQGVGTTTVLLNLGVTAARQGRRVLVVDGNLRRPAVADRLGVADRPGLREALAGSVPLEQAVLETDQPGLAALPAGTPAPPSAPPPAAHEVRPLLRELRRRFDLVLLDGPRWDGRPDVSALGRACDAVFLVVPAAEADSPVVDELTRLIPGQGARLAGCVLADR
jgi:Mrp family chromosome partitioning ATPase